MADRDDDFLARWARRKADARTGLRRKRPESAAPGEQAGGAAREGAPVPDRPAPKSAGAHKTAAVAPETEGRESIHALREEGGDGAPVPLTPPAKDDLEVEDPEALEAFKDVDFDKLNYASDYSRFMEKGVPDAIRRRALRRLWGSNPLLANIDGLNDYDEDFTDAALAVRILGSNYKPGSGYLSEEERLASQSEEARRAGEAEDGEDRETETDLAEADETDDLDVDDFGDGEWDGGDRLASGDTAEGEGEPREGDPARKPDDNDKA